MERRVVVTGVGLVTPLGLDTASTWEGLLSGRSGIDTVSLFDASTLAVPIAGEVRGFQPMEAAREKVSETYMNRPLRFGVAATRMALDAAGIGPGEVDPARMGVSMGAGAGLPAMESVIEEYRNHMKGGALDPSTFRAIGDEDWRRTFVLRSSHLASSDIHKIGRFFSGEYVRYTPTRGEFDIAK